MSGHLDQMDPLRKRYDYLREHLEDAHEQAGNVASHLAGARIQCRPDMPEAEVRAMALAERARQLDRDIGRLLDDLFPQEEPEDDDDGQND